MDIKPRSLRAALQTAAVAAIVAVPALAQQAEVKISLVNGSAREQQAKEQIERLLETDTLPAMRQAIERDPAIGQAPR